MYCNFSKFGENCEKEIKGYKAFQIEERNILGFIINTFYLCKTCFDENKHLLAKGIKEKKSLSDEQKPKNLTMLEKQEIIYKTLLSSELPLCQQDIRKKGFNRENYRLDDVLNAMIYGAKTKYKLYAANLPQSGITSYKLYYSTNKQELNLFAEKRIKEVKDAIILTKKKNFIPNSQESFILRVLEIEKDIFTLPELLILLRKRKYNINQNQLKILLDKLVYYEKIFFKVYNYRTYYALKTQKLLDFIENDIQEKEKN